MQLDLKLFILNDSATSAAMAADLQACGYVVKICTNFEDFEKQCAEFQPHLLIVQKTVGGRDCLSLIEKIRSDESHLALPIIVTMETADITDEIKALKIGADVVLFMPVHPEKLATKVQALLRRSISLRPKEERVLYKSLRLSPLSGEVFLGGDRLSFTNTEFKLLQVLIQEKGKPVRRETLALRSLSSRSQKSRTIDVHINSIRNKLGDIGDFLKTLRGRGYMMIDDKDTNHSN